MTQEDKELLFKDLCARLPYNVICQVEFRENGKYNSKVMLLSGIFTDEAYFTTKGGSIYSNEYKPYLFPLSSMTEEEFTKLKEYSGLKYDQLDLTSFQNGAYKMLNFSLSKVPSGAVSRVFDWLNKYHFDYRDLIQLDLAIAVTKENNPYKE